MDLNVYQTAAGETARYPDTTEMPIRLIYCALKLNGEAGEYAEKIGKCMRDNRGHISEELRHQLILELGDILWYVARSAYELGIPLNEVARINLEKLKSRQARDQLHGSGDNR